MAVTKVSRDRHEEIIERYRAGETAEIIGSAHGLTRQGVCRSWTGTPWPAGLAGINRSHYGCPRLVRTSAMGKLGDLP